MSKLPPNNTPYNHSISQDVIELSDDDSSESDDCSGGGGDVSSNIIATVVGAVITPPKKKKRKEATFWTVSSDTSTFVATAGEQAARFTIRGEPQALRRPGPRRRLSGQMLQGRPFFNQSKGKQAEFREAVHNLLRQSAPNAMLFPGDVPIAVSITFRLRRPNSHFVGCNRERKLLKDSAPTGYAFGRVDLDNLVKFVLDCLNGLLYNDDRQVVDIKRTTKIWDSDGDCTGSTSVELLLVASNN
jgi:Holliday junction resolvase RusA-like endonuclease